MIRVNRDEVLSEDTLIGFEPLGSLRPEWLGEDRTIPLIFPRIYKNNCAGEVLAYFNGQNGRLPAIVLSGKDMVFNFDPKETVDFLMRESYLVPKNTGYKFLPFNYQIVPGEIRRFIKKLTVIAARKRFKLSSFPSWPIEASVETMRHILLQGRPYISWPQGKKFAVILSHDIDTHEGFANVNKFIAIEKKYGLISSWFVVGSLFASHVPELKALKGQDLEIGCHGYLHDNKLVALTLSKMKESLLNCGDMIKELGVRGFRSPSLFRSRELFEALEGVFSYDTSVPDTEVFLQYAPHSGCCTVFPYRAQGALLEVPITMPLDSTLLALGLSIDEMFEIWKNKISWIKKVGGIAHFLNHAESYYSGNPKMLGLYERLADFISHDRDCWVTKACDAAEWWSAKEKELISWPM